MAKVRQLPEVYLRGSLANETMKGLTQEEQKIVSAVTSQIMEHPALAGDRSEFVYRLATTIACDYHDHEVGKQELRIAVWRGVVHLLYHCSYGFRCHSCDSTGYRSQRGVFMPFDRRLEPCPVCKKVRITKSGGNHQEGDFVCSEELQTELEELRQRGQTLPEYTSAILPTKLKRKIPDPDKVLNDPDQVTRFFRTFIWNYFRQILLENSITHHEKKSTTVTGAADKIIADSVASLMKDMKISHVCNQNGESDTMAFLTLATGQQGIVIGDGHYCYAKTNPEITGKYFSIQCEPLTTPPELTFRFCELLNRAYQNGIAIEYTDKFIAIPDTGAAAPCIDVQMVVNEEVQVANNRAAQDDASDHDLIKALESPGMDSTTQLETQDTIATLRSSLPEPCQAVLDIILGYEPTYSRFAAQSKQATPTRSAIAKFLNCAPNDVKRHQRMIGMRMLSLGMVDNE